MSVSLDHVILAARSGAASLAAELCGYIVLGAADQVGRAPCQLFPAGVELGSAGEVTVRPGRATEEIAAEGSLRRLLSQLLEAARPGSPALERASRRPVGCGVAGFVGEIEAALVPVNRGAARRALARLHREAMRAQPSVVSDLASPAPSPRSSERTETSATDGARMTEGRASRQAQGSYARESSVPFATVDEQSRESLQPSGSLPPVEVDPSSSAQTDPMDTGYGSLPRVEHVRLAREPRHRDKDERTPKLGSIAVHAPEVEHDEFERRSWSGSSIHVDVDDLGDETPLFSRPAPGSGALPATELPAVENVATACVELDEGDGHRQERRPSGPPAAPALLPLSPAARGHADTVVGVVATPSRVESLVDGFTAAECRSVRELCRELQQIAGVEGGDGQSSLPPPATKEKAH
jgi:hypothetical protein